MILQQFSLELLLFPVEMRLKVKTGINNCSLIDDSYSSDFQSLALDFLESQKQFPKDGYSFGYISKRLVQ
jgi:UDP-N-acetylmuramyl pentapeptide synthase